MESNKNLASVKNFELSHNVYDADNKSYGQETRERNARHRDWQKRGVEPPLSREEIRFNQSDGYTRRSNSGSRLVPVFILCIFVFLLGATLSSGGKTERQSYLDAHPSCKLVATEEMPEEPVRCGKRCTRPAVLETYQCGTKIKRLLNKE